MGLFLDAPSHLYMRSCPSVGPSVRPSVRRSVGPSRVIFEGEKYAILGASCAVYPALFIRRLPLSLSIWRLVTLSFELSVCASVYV